MQPDKQHFEEQDHPLKNTDKAFVQVGKNGEPVLPQTADQQNSDEQAANEKTNVTYDRP